MDFKLENPHRNGIASLVVHLFAINSSQPGKDYWTLEEIYNDLYPQGNKEKAKSISILLNNLKWIKSKKAIEFKNSSSIRLNKYRLSTLIDEMYNTSR